MEKTMQALDEMFSRLITQVWGYATSGKLWITVGAMYIGYTQGGMEGALAAIGMGGVFVAAKTYQNSKVIQAKANGQAVQPKPAVPKPVTSQAAPEKQLVQQEQYIYEDPFDPKLWGSEGATAYLRWEEFEDAYTRINFNDYNPSIRLEFANQLVEEGRARLNLAWEEAFKEAGATETPPMPEEEDFNAGMRLTEQAIAKLESYLPKTCGWLSSKVYNVTLLSIATAKWYQMSHNLNSLWDKNVDWVKAATLSEIRRRGLGVVSNKPHLVVNKL